MVLLWIGIGVGVLIALILIVIVKTSSNEVLGVSGQCSKCGMKIYSTKCPRCNKKTEFGR